ncbi:MULTISPECIES: MGMT family protein [unclassified Planococcus (in: firmicutes)]|uniref:MGMT family protein n=1 Tax=Planococcus TaxID=1372 RepID=UPI000C33C1FC|nr:MULTISPECIES: methylated-DNA--[protein]-cysteine S-methyltransferase [unclassified Planococcus (in: firmicutes)]AUD14310.1 DNA methyltransferase [Planococcus sp. MB-3u-03]PKG46603.1 DNA methyltransferase [Planococcus sp. Urea-trap-24]PKG89544.1 DNA methyltransferase [Planococcus sp. Urea-3u-39]PKH42890.1 DNA methyltransferase [Planococcus sp. MB-3u-09]
MQPFTKKAIDVMKNIPQGKIMSYGQVAHAAGSPRSARQVARILHSMSEKHNIPWHRIVNAKGEIAIKDGEGRYTQQLLLEEEGLCFEEEGKVSLSHYQHFPDL